MPKMKTKSERGQALPRSPGRHRQARPGVQAPHPDQEDHQEQAPPARRGRCHETNMRFGARDAAVSRLRSDAHASSQTWCNGPRPPQEGSRPGQGFPRPPQERLPHRQGSGDEGRAICLPRPPQQEARLPPALDRPHQRGRARARPDLQRVHERPEKAGIEIDRKVLADIAVHDKAGFRQDRRAGQGRSLAH